VTRIQGWLVVIAALIVAASAVTGAVFLHRIAVQQEHQTCVEYITAQATSTQAGGAAANQTSAHYINNMIPHPCGAGATIR
jgi:hypothetical protein